MSVSISNLFNYSRTLPPPFDTLPNKKVKSVASKYADKTEATLCCSVIKAIHAFIRCSMAHRKVLWVWWMITNA